MRLAEVFDDGCIGRIYESSEVDALGLAQFREMAFALPFLGYFEVTEDVCEDWQYLQGEFLPPREKISLEEMKEEKLKEIATARFREETGGIVVDGIRFDTSRESQALLTGAALQASIDSSYTCRWKAADGFVNLSANDLLRIASLVRSHVQECFEKEAIVSSQILSAISKAEFSQLFGKKYKLTAYSRFFKE